uniref:Uncharacterized protein n=1 Tax=Arundo donax TaxID=35708 RepID=A0A0A9AQE5_ARUDO
MIRVSSMEIVMLSCVSLVVTVYSWTKVFIEFFLCTKLRLVKTMNCKQAWDVFLYGGFSLL